MILIYRSCVKIKEYTCYLYRGCIYRDKTVPAGYNGHLGVYNSIDK